MTKPLLEGDMNVGGSMDLVLFVNGDDSACQIHHGIAYGYVCIAIYLPGRRGFDDVVAVMEDFGCCVLVR